MAAAPRPTHYILHARLKTGQHLVFSQGIRPTFYPAGIATIEIFAVTPTSDCNWISRSLTRAFLHFQRFARAWLAWRRRCRRELLTPRAILKREAHQGAVWESHHLESCRPRMGWGWRWRRWRQLPLYEQ